MGIGALVGVVVAAVAKDENAGLGVSAAGLAVLGLLVGKLLIFQWAAPGAMVSEVMADPDHQAAAVSFWMYDTKQFEPSLQSRIDNWPEDEAASDTLDNEVNTAIQTRMAGMSESDTTAAVEHYVQAILGELTWSDRVLPMLSGWDILWALLAVISAFQIARGGVKTA